MLPKKTFYFGTAGTILNWYDVLDGQGKLAFRVIPAQELGTPQAEWMIATDGHYGGPFSDLALVAFTNTTAVNGGGSPLSSFVTGTLPVAYADPPTSISQPGSSHQFIVDSLMALPGQLQYQGGHLLAA